MPLEPIALLPGLGGQGNLFLDYPKQCKTSKGKEGLVIETKGCDSGLVGTAPIPAFCFQLNLGEVIRSLPLTQNPKLLLSFPLS